MIEDVFKHLIKSATELGITDGKIQVIDSTSIETKYKTDPDARWNYDPTRKAYYFGYGLLCMMCPLTHMPLNAEFTDGKHASRSWRAL